MSATANDARCAGCGFTMGLTASWVGGKQYHPACAPTSDQASVRTQGNLITESAYWRDPVQVFMGACWLIVGGLIGFVLARLT